MVSLFSPVFSEIRFPISKIMFLVEGPKTPEVSIATGSNLNLLTRSGYFALFEFSALPAALPASMAVSFTELSPKVFMHVASQQSTLPWLKGKIVIPSGLFPSPRLSPTGSSTDGTPADFNARQMMSFNAACRGCLPSLKWHESRWYPCMSTFFPHLHVWFSHILDPVLKAIAILSSSGLSWVPRLGTGIADAHDPDSD